MQGLHLIEWEIQYVTVGEQGSQEERDGKVLGEEVFWKLPSVVGEILHL